MTDEEIKNYFGTRVIYKYIGKLQELESKLLAFSINHNRLIVNDIIYFICPLNNDATVISDDKLSVFYTPEGL